MSEQPDDNQMDDDDSEVAEAGMSPQAEDELLRLKSEGTMLREKLARVQADFQNSRKRLEEDAEKRLQYANSGLLKAMLPLIDNFERAMSVDAEKTDAASILKGLHVLRDQWIAMLKQQSVEVIAPKPGDAFDPSLHTAVLQQDHDTYGPTTVVNCLQNGYRMMDRVLRPASVAVGKAK
jgi:molecular chaperone GrpE